MVLMILATLLILGIAYYQVVQGLYSAIIMAILTITCAVLAFNYYEPFAMWLLYDRQPAYAEAVSLIALFVLPLLGLRFLFDRFLGGNVVMGVWPDRVAGGVVGLISGIVMVGVLAVAAQLMPWGRTIITYQPFDDTLNRNQRLHPFRPDEFTLGMVRTFSGGSLRGERRWSTVHGDLLLDAWCAHNQMEQTYVDKERNEHQVRLGVLTAMPGSLSIDGVYIPPENADWTYDVPSDPRDVEFGGSRVVIVRVGVSEDVRDDEADWWRLPATHFRLVTDAGRSCYPLGYLTARTYGGQLDRARSYDAYREATSIADWQLSVPPTNDEHVSEVGKLIVARPWFKNGGPKVLKVDWVFRIPAGETPAWMALRRTARAELPPAIEAMPDRQEALARPQ